MKVVRGLWMALALVLAAPAFAAKPNARGITAWSQPNFTLYSHDSRKARDVAERMAIVEVVLTKLLRRERMPDGMPTHVFIARESLWSRYIQPSQRIIGEFVPTRFSNYLLLNAYLSNEFLDETVDHESTHSFLRSFYVGQIPAWYDEGVAELIGASELLRKSITVGYPDVYRDVRWLPTERLLGADKKSPEYLTLDTHLFHFQSWAFVHKAIIDDREFGRRMYAYLGAVGDGVPIESAVQRSFGMSVAELDDVLREYSRRDRYRVARMEFDSPPPAELGAGRAMSELEGLEFVARVMLDTGFNAKRLQEVIALAKQLAPTDPRVLLLELRMAIRDGDEAAVAALLKTLGPMTSEPVISRAAGIALFERVREALTGDSPLQGASLAEANLAFDMLDRAERTLPVDPEASWAYGILASGLGRECAFALQRLEMARESMPRHADLSMATALLHRRMAQPDAMLVELRKTASFARTAELRQWARQRINAADARQVSP